MGSGLKKQRLLLQPGTMVRIEIPEYELYNTAGMLSPFNGLKTTVAAYKPMYNQNGFQGDIYYLTGISSSSGIPYSFVRSWLVPIEED